MLSAVLAGTSRHPRRVLGGSVVVAAGFLAVFLPSEPDAEPRLTAMVLLPLLALLTIVLAMVAQARWRPAAFVVDTEAAEFRAPPQPGHVFLAAGAVLFAVGACANAVRYHRTDPGRFAALTTVLCIVTVLFLVSVWRGLGVRLRPDGVVDRSAIGALTVPWDVLSTTVFPATTPMATTLPLTYDRPALVRVRGLSLTRRRLRTETINAAFLADAIRHYLTHPGQRERIGTPAGYADLLAALHAPGQR